MSSMEYGNKEVALAVVDTLAKHGLINVECVANEDLDNLLPELLIGFCSTVQVVQ